MNPKIKVLMVEPDKEPYTAEIDNTLEPMQKVVGGLIECLGLEENVSIICNEEGKLLELPPNRCVGNDIIVGTFFIAGCNENGEFISLTDKQIGEYMAEFKNPEAISQEEVSGTMHYTILNL